MPRWAGALAIIVLSLGLTAAAPSPIDRLAGVYKVRFQNQFTGGETYMSENILEIVKVDPKAAYFRAELQFVNGHQCSLSGMAEIEKDYLVFFEKEDDGHLCRLEMRPVGGKLALADDGTCRAYCGARGHFDMVAFPLSSKRTIRYMPRLLGSAEYKAALAEYRKR